MDSYIDLLVAAGWIDPTIFDDEYQKFLKNSPCEDEFKTYEDFQAMKHELAEAIKVLDATECKCGLHQSLFGKPDPQCDWHRAMNVASQNEYWLGY